MTSISADTARVYSYLGPAGTFTEQALKQVAEAEGQIWKPVLNVSQALADVVDGISNAAMIAIENSLDGGVTATQDALAKTDNLQILGEYLVPVNFVLVSRRNVSRDEITTIAAHPVAYAQCRAWLEKNLPKHRHIPATSNAQAAVDLFGANAVANAAIAPPTITEHYNLTVHATDLAGDLSATTRFVLVGPRQPAGEPSGHDKTSLIVDLPDDRAGALLTLLEQFAAHGVNLTQIASRPTGSVMGSYRFYIDAEGHIREERVRYAVLGLKLHSPNVRFLGSYARADKIAPSTDVHHSDAAFKAAKQWLNDVVSGVSEAGD
ncbi:prephenate dehydratase [Canibacter zhoujuaniae]|uniref:prephenate dehydratase n=1 Tax=Canibacter zhoujuaniae TaxID=2708343 RepID=UPI001421FA62|nr:prephenate dehydratase [Canibacter zhoujuaniae]